MLGGNNNNMGLLDILRLYAILVKKCLLLVKCVFGAIFHYLLLITDWVVRQTEQHQPTGEYVKPERPAVDTVTGKTDSGTDCVNAADTVNTGEDAADDELQYPVSCESDGEEELAVITGVPTVREKLEGSVECRSDADDIQQECCSEVDGPQDLVLAVPKIPECWRKQCLQEKTSSQDVQEDASCDESEDEEDSRADCLNYREEEEKFEFCGAVPDHSSDMKSDHGNKDEVMITAEESQSVITGDGSFVPSAGITGGGDQQCEGEEANDDRKKQQATMPPNSTCEQPAVSQGQRETPRNHNHGNCGETLPNNTPND